MKEIVIIIIILILIITGAIYTQNYLNKTSKILIDDLKDLREETEMVKESNEREKIKTMSEEMYSKWEDINKRWSIVVLHDEIDLIETSLTKMKSSIEVGSLEIGLKELDVSVFLLNHIKEREQVSLKNIF